MFLPQTRILHRLARLQKEPGDSFRLSKPGPGLLSCLLLKVFTGTTEIGSRPHCAYQNYYRNSFPEKPLYLSKFHELEDVVQKHGQQFKNTAEKICKTFRLFCMLLTMAAAQQQKKKSFLLHIMGIWTKHPDKPLPHHYLRFLLESCRLTHSCKVPVHFASKTNLEQDQRISKKLLAEYTEYLCVCLGLHSISLLPSKPAPVQESEDGGHLVRLHKCRRNGILVVEVFW